MSATAKVIELKGDPKNPESAEHLIIFPGGSISVFRTSNNEYWAHIEVNREQVLSEAVRMSAMGEIISTRIDYDRPPGCIKHLEDMEDVQHVAVRIKTTT